MRILATHQICFIFGKTLEDDGNPLHLRTAPSLGAFAERCSFWSRLFVGTFVYITLAGRGMSLLFLVCPAIWQSGCTARVDIGRTCISNDK